MNRKPASGRRVRRPLVGAPTAANSSHLINQVVNTWLVRIVGKLRIAKEVLPVSKLTDQLTNIEANLDEAIAEGQSRPSLSPEEQAMLDRVAAKAKQAADLVQNDPNAPAQP